MHPGKGVDVAVVGTALQRPVAVLLQAPRVLSGAPSPSCGARRMIETSAHLIDHVIPRVPVRQWVLSFPWPLRMLFASRPQALGRCLAVITRAIQTDLAQRAGLKATDGARTGIVTLIQRFGSALNLDACEAR